MRQQGVAPSGSRARGRTTAAKRRGRAPDVASVALAAVLCASLVGFPVLHAQTASLPASTFAGWEVSSLKVRGIDSGLAKKLVSGLILDPHRNGSGGFAPRLSPALLEEDLRRADLFLARHGYRRSRIDVEFVPAEKKRTVKLTLRVHGQPVRIDRVDLEGFPQSWPGPGLALREVRPGSVASDTVVVATAAALRKTLLDSGYADAQVRPDIEPIDSSRVGLVFTAIPGPLVFFGETRVEGGPADLRPLAARTADIPRGSLFSAQRLRDAEDDLRMLGLFGMIRVTQDRAAPDTMDVAVSVQARAPVSIETGAGYWNDEGLRFSASIEHRNLLARGRGMGTSGSYTQYTRNGAVWARWLSFPLKRSRSELRLYVDRTIEASFTQDEYGIRASSGYWFTPRTNIDFGVQILDYTVRAEQTAATGSGENGILTVLTGALSHQGTDDLLRPTRGVTNTLDLEWGAAGLSNVGYLRGQTRNSLRATMHGQNVLTLRLWLGVAQAEGSTGDLPPSKRFFAGGVDSHRGFSRRRLGPKDPTGEPIGGDAMGLASSDLRVPLVWILSGTVFADAGQVWRSFGSVQAGNIEVAVGAGLSLDTPVGPIRLEQAWRLTRSSDEPMRALHFAVGNPL
jgi:outer membrane protein assembly factor BamA